MHIPANLQVQTAPIPVPGGFAPDLQPTCLQVNSPSHHNMLFQGFKGYLSTCKKSRQMNLLSVFRPSGSGYQSHSIHVIQPDRSGKSRYLDPFPGLTILKQKTDEKKILMCFLPDQPFYILSQKDCLWALSSIENSKGLSVRNVIIYLAGYNNRGCQVMGFHQ